MHDRHARHRRAAADRRRRPVDGFRVGGDARFGRLVGDAVAELPDGLLRYLDDVEVAVAEVPVVRPDDREVRLAEVRRVAPSRARRRGSGARFRLTLYRRPLEARAHDRHDLLGLVQVVIVQELADQFGLDDDRLDDLGWP